MNNFMTINLITEVDKFPQRHKLSKFTQEEIENCDMSVPTD